MIDKNKLAMLESGRWYMLLTIAHAGELGATEEMVIEPLRQAWLGTTRSWLREQLDYLAGTGKELVRVDRHEIKSWRAYLTPRGNDVVNYVVDAPPGVGRPKKYFGDSEA